MGNCVGRPHTCCHHAEMVRLVARNAALEAENQTLLRYFSREDDTLKKLKVLLENIPGSL